ncbi:MAG: exodeoxyribonuclease VII large subunit [Minisyncoccia bacterium]
MNVKLLELLKNKRKEIAQRENIEIYKVFSNATLEATAEAEPKNKNDLLKIKGWGKKKIEKYGDEILAIINNTEFITKIFSVSSLLESANYILQSQIGRIKVEGEISDINLRSNFNGINYYFSLKDIDQEGYGVNCFVSSYTSQRFQHLIEDGLRVIVTGHLSIWKSGKFEFMVETIEPVGEGAIKKAFEALKKKLEQKGYFDIKRKRALPLIIQDIGLITSAQGDAINDFLSNVGNYGFNIKFLDVRVEGDYAEDYIVSAINWFNKNMPSLDVLVLIRGGGSLESLNTFNSERIADAIVTSRIPIITGIGHEKDETIAGYVSDLNLTSPTAVGNFIKQTREKLIDSVAINLNNLLTATEKILFNTNVTIDNFIQRINIALNNIFSNFYKLENIFIQKINIVFNNIIKFKNVVDIFENSLFNSFNNNLTIMLNKINLLNAQLLELNPQSILQRGYSIIYSRDGKIIKDINVVKINQDILIKLYKGQIESQVKKVINDGQ